MEVLVYKTNIREKQDVEKVEAIFKTHHEILKWHVDMEDDDCVLRIETQTDITGKVENLVRKAGYCCSELE